MKASKIPNLEAYLQRCSENIDEAKQIIAEASQDLRYIGGLVFSVFAIFVVLPVVMLSAKTKV